MVLLQILRLYNYMWMTCAFIITLLRNNEQSLGKIPKLYINGIVLIYDDVTNAVNDTNTFGNIYV